MLAISQKVFHQLSGGTNARATRSRGHRRFRAYDFADLSDFLEKRLFASKAVALVSGWRVAPCCELDDHCSWFGMCGFATLLAFVLRLDRKVMQRLQPLATLLQFFSLPMRRHQLA